MSRLTPARRRIGPPPNPQRRALARVIGAALALGLVGAGLALGLSRLESYARRLPGGPTRVEWVNLPAWLREPSWSPVLAELEAATGVTPDVDVSYPRLCETVAAKLVDSPWVERVRRVTKRADGLIAVDAIFRRPYAWVERDGIAHLIDDTGAVLPLRMQPEQVDTQRWLLVRGVQAKPPPLGQRWVGDDLGAGLKLASFLYRAGESNTLECRADLRAIDVSNYKLRRDRMSADLRLILATGTTVIEWGLPPGDEYDIQLPAVQKLGLIEGLYRAHGSLPGASRVDVRFPGAPDISTL